MRVPSSYAGLVLVALLGLTAVVGVAPGPHRDGTPVRPVAASPCSGPITAKQVVGQRPDHLRGLALSRFWGDTAVCRGRWLGGRPGRFVPQGVTVLGSSLWVTGYDHDPVSGQDTCRVLELDAASLAVDRVTADLHGTLPDGSTTTCAHAGGVAVDDHGVWVSDTVRLWLLRPDLSVRRVWRLAGEVRGSAAVVDPGRGLGLGRYSTRGLGRIDWFDPDALVASRNGVLRDSPRAEPVPDRLQGLGRGALTASTSAGTWQLLAGRGCTVRAGPDGQRVPLAPAGEGLALDGDQGVWTLSEASVARYWRPGRRVLPQLLRYSAPLLTRQAASDGGRAEADRCLASID